MQWFTILSGFSGSNCFISELYAPWGQGLLPASADGSATQQSLACIHTQEPFADWESASIMEHRHHNLSSVPEVALVLG